ncbi:MAG: rhamnulokinase family protein [Planctomycetota bacterium]
MPSAHLAIDLGASSGRAILGILSASPKTLQIKEIHRFEHIGLPTPTGPVWNLTDIWRNILEGMKKTAAYCVQQHLELESIGVDTWGVDWALLGESGELLALPHCYRDPQNNAAHTEALEKLGGFPWLYERSGIQDMAINTLFQVYARFKEEPQLFAAARHLVFMPDLFHFWLSGKISVERSIASTSAMLNVANGTWDYQIFERLGMPTHLLGPIIDPGTRLGTVTAEVAGATGVPSTLAVVAPASHDTGSAVAAVPAETTEGWAYLSSGTWSLLGAELSKPNCSQAALEVPFTNELGIDGTVRFLKNITGLWMVQELRREHNEQNESETGFAELMQLAEAAEPCRTLVDPSFGEFLAPGNMAGKIAAFAERTGQPVPETIGQFVRCCLESLAFCYRDVLEKMQEVVGQSFSQLHVVGGGSKNSLLNQLTADITGMQVICGPAEATAIGNVLIQAIGCDQLADINELREVVKRCTSPEVVVPNPESAYPDAFGRYEVICAKAASTN